MPPKSKLDTERTVRNDDTSNETSPLLSKPDSTPPPPIEPSSSLIPDTNNQHHNAAEDKSALNPSDPSSTDPDSDLERIPTTNSTAGRTEQYAGLPELRKKMPYIFPALSIGVFLAAADQTIIVSSYGRIGSDLDALERTGWIATAYFLTLTSFQPLYGKLSDIFSRKSCLLFAYIVFGLGCLGCGLARDINQLILARAIAGIGGGGMTTVVSILLSDVIPLKERGTWQGYINIIYASGAGIGAPLGGLFADGVGWRWSFLFQAPLCLVAFVAVALVVELPPKEEEEVTDGVEVEGMGEQAWKKKIKRVDFLGAAVLVAAVFALLLGLDRGSNVAWRTAWCLVPLCVSFPLFALFLFIEWRVAAEPFAPGHIILERTLFACYLCNFFSFAGYLATLFYMPLYFQAVQGYSALKAGLLLLPSVIAGVSGSLFGGRWMQYFGRYYWLTVCAYSNLVLGLILILLCSGGIIKSDIGMCIGMAICGFSNGIGVTSSLIALISNASREDQGIATACSYLFRSLGSTAGVSLSTSIANQTLRMSLQKHLGSGKDADKIIQGVRRSLKYIKGLSPEVKTIVRSSYETSTRAAFGLQIALVAGAAVSAWAIREKPLSR